MNHSTHGITISYIDEVIHDYIMTSSDNDYTSILEKDARNEIYTQLDRAYNNSLSWYPFDAEAHVLVLEAGFGPFLGDLCSRVKKVTVLAPSFLHGEAISHRYKNHSNLNVNIGNLESLQDVQAYDYVIAMGEGFCNRQDMERLLSCVGQNGRLLLGVNNRFGLQHWCGKADMQSGIPLEGIVAGRSAGRNGERNGGKQGEDRKGLKELFFSCGLLECDYKFYYPMPDYGDVKGIYSDERLPKEEEIPYLIGNYVTHQTSLLMVETDILPDIVANGGFSFFANSYLIEISRDGCFAEVDCGLLNETSAAVGNVEAADSEDGCKSLFFQIEQARGQAAGNRELLAVKGKANVWKPDCDAECLRSVRQVQLDLLGRLKIVCDRHHLQLYAIYGTLLGAIRHGGMIPGDDDIDVALPREDYDKLLKLADKFSEPYFLQTPWNDQCFYGGYSRLRNIETTSIHPDNRWTDCCEGIGIDIFPLDYGYGNPFLQWLKKKRICFYQRMLYAKAYGYAARFQDMPLLIWKFYKYLGLLFSRQKLADRLGRIVSDGDGKHNFGIYTHYSRGKTYRKLSISAFADKITMQYEDILIDAPADYDELLTKLYGNNYMSMPSYNEGKLRHGFYVADTPYEYYKKRFLWGNTLDLGDKELVLFGDESLFSYFLDRYKKYIPAHIVSIGTWKSPKEINGIQVENFADFMREYPMPDNKDKIYGVICTIYIREAEQILKGAGLEEYHIYTYNWEWLLLADPSYALKEIEKDGAFL